MKTIPVKKIGKVLGAIVLGILIALGSLVVIAFGWQHFHKPPVVATKPPLPVTCKYRRALLANGYVAIFTNTSPQVLGVLATFENLTFKTNKSFRLNLDPNVPVQFGHLEGWDFTAGDKITLQESHYQNAIFTIP
jgi:hypothetical protein